MYGIVDCDNCYVSCERVFRPDLNGKAVVVLSNNDGCVVARSNEAKKMGIKAGTPYFQLAQLYPNNKIAVFSSNYELYGELTGRIVEIIKQEAPAYFRYSIDECFVYFPDRQWKMDNGQLTMPGDNFQFSIINYQFLKTWGEALHKRIRKSVGMPVSIGIAPTKTLAKMASHFAKKYPGYRHCCMIDTDEKRVKALKLYPIEDVWGIGRRYAAKLQALGVKTVYDFAQHHDDWVRNIFNNIVIYRTWQELNGIDAVPNEEMAKKKSICTSRSFNGMVSDFETLRTHVTNYAVRCAEKLRAQKTVAGVIGVFLNTNVFREDLPQYWNFQEKRLIVPTCSTIEIAKAATEVLQKIFIPGYKYKKAGVIVMSVGPNSPVQTDLFDYNAEQFQKMKRLDAVIDHINKVNGSETLVLGSQQYTKKDGKGKVATEREQSGACSISAERKQARPKVKAEVFANAIKHGPKEQREQSQAGLDSAESRLRKSKAQFKSKNPTTRWSDIIVLK